jgi:glycosyltransferase involved in cell wall biosynthesis
MRIALIGDAESPHLLKWGRALVATPGVELWVASSRGFAPGWDGVVPAARRFALGTRPRAAGGNLGVLRRLPALARWLAKVDADWLHAHYLTSHGTLAWLALRGWRLRGRLAVSAWGSDVLVTPERSALYRWAARRVLRACSLATSDSAHMAGRMRALGAAEVMTFPFGLEAMPAPPPAKQPWLCFANRGLEPVYRPERVLALFAQIAAAQPAAQLAVANDGALAATLPAAARALGLTVGRLADGARVEFTGRLDAVAQDAWYRRAQWFVSLPASDSVAVSVLEAMAQGCIPILSDLPANRELVRDGENGAIVAETDTDTLRKLQPLLDDAAGIAADNRRWIAENALFAPAVARFVERLRALAPSPRFDPAT